LVRIAEKNNDAQLLAGVRALADYLLERPTLDGVFETWESSPLLTPYSGEELSPTDRALLENPPAGVFVDCLHFDPPFLVELGRVTGERRYIDVGIKQTLGYIGMLQSPKGLFDHFALRGVAGSFGPAWGRGQGWAMLGLLEVSASLRAIGDIGENILEAIESSAARLLEAMIKLQRPDGHWFAVVTDPDSGDEFSTAAFMATALDHALTAGIIKGELAEMAQRSARAAVINSLDSEGQLREVSAAVYASTIPSHYAHVPRGYVVPWGQGPALLALLSVRLK
jgi:unsaturated rhamnogalacturonyl hydrolase